MSRAVIVSAVRSPIGRRGGSLSTMRADELLARVLKECPARVGVDAAEIEDVITGCVHPIGEQGFNISRTAALMAGFPVSVAGTTLNRQCGSSQQALHFAAMAIESGQQEVVLAAGVEMLSRTPIGSDLAGPRPFWPASPMLTGRFEKPTQFQAGEMIAKRWKISRRDCEELALRSHRLAAAAREAGRFRDEILPIGAFAADEGIRPETSLEKMAALPPVIEGGDAVTAATSSQISDGAAAILFMSEEKARQLGLRPRARVHATALAGVDPVMMLHGPIPATKQVLARAGLGKSEIDLVEINEAFASVVLAWSRELEWPLDHVNVNGGAIALGHPLGCSGVRLLTTLLHEMERREVRFGLSTMCIGFGQATATILERMT